MDLIDSSIEDGEDTIKILLTTDNHVGYKETDPIRADDSFKTFNEIIMTAKEQDVDFIVHGGDLFDVNKPSKKSLYNVMESLRSHCLGDKPCEVEVLSDYSAVSGSFFPVNYEDPNINVSIPIFAISGNHDDATGTQLLLPMDVLAVSGLVNNFGKVLLANEITVSPILLQKGNTKFALYGMSHVKDDRLFRIFREGNVKFLRPDVYTDDWFNLLCVHQNHHPYSSKKSYLPEQVLPDFLDFIYWGHEHECIPEPQFNPVKNFHTLLPGSSIVTALSDGEAHPKHVFILKVKGRKFKLQPVPLKTARPFVIDSVSLQQEGFDPSSVMTNTVSSFLCQRVEQLIVQAMDEYTSTNTLPSMDAEDIAQFKKNAPLPLIRLKVDVTGGFQLENIHRLSRKFVGKVANVDDIFSIHQKTQTSLRVKGNAPEDISIDKSSLTEETLIASFAEESNLNLLPEQGISKAVREFVEKDDKNAISEYIQREIKREAKKLMAIDLDAEKFLDEDLDPKAAFKALLTKFKAEEKNKIIATKSDSEDEAPPPKLRAKKNIKASPKARPKRSTARAPVSAEIIVSSDDSGDEYKADDVMLDQDIEIILSDEEPKPKRKTATRKRR